MAPKHRRLALNPFLFMTAENEETQLRGKIKGIDLAEGENGVADGKSKAVKIKSRSAAKGSTSQSRVGGKPAFPAPSLELVQQAFQMLDPTGSGTLNPIALREVLTPCTIPSNGSSNHKIVLAHLSKCSFSMNLDNRAVAGIMICKKWTTMLLLAPIAS